MTDISKILITGGTGQLGTDLQKVLSGQYQIEACGSEDFDITDINATRENVKNYQPDFVIHAAAYTDVDGCEENPDKAFAVNGLGTRNVAIASRQVGAPLFYISTDYVFNGEKSRPYKEYDNRDPQTVYGKSKLLGERFVKEQMTDFFILRIAWLYGANGNNFVKTMLGLAEEKDKLQVVDDQFGSPTWTIDVAEQINKLLSTQAFGTYHCTSQGSCSWHEFARYIFNRAERDIKLEPVGSSEFSRKADRPKNSVLDNYFLSLNNYDQMPHWKESLKKFLDDYLSKEAE